MSDDDIDRTSETITVDGHDTLAVVVVRPAPAGDITVRTHASGLSRSQLAQVLRQAADGWQPGEPVQGDIMQTLVAERKRQRLSQEFMAERIGVTQGCISRWESRDGRPISADQAQQYARVLGAQLAVQLPDSR